MGQKIDRDAQRFRRIVRGKVKSNLGKYISRGEMIGKKGKDLVSIPLPQIDLPQFRYGQKGSGGVPRGGATATGVPATSRAGTSSKLNSRWRSWPPSSARSWPCRGSSRAA